MGNKKIIKCPFFQRLCPDDCINCENICSNLGFDVNTRLKFSTKAERKNFFELFCSDMYIECPYYKVVVENHEKERSLKNGKTKRAK